MHLIRSARITDPNSPHNGKKADILIDEKGRIKAIDKQISLSESGTAKVIETDGLYVSPGWFDLCANFCDPGFEYKEDLTSGVQTAADGGFTGVAVMPSTYPPIDNKAGIDYIRNKTNNAVVDVFPVGTLSKGMKGEELSEMYDMHLAGAIAFSDDNNYIQNPALFKTALLYVKSFNGRIFSFPLDKRVAPSGLMNEGQVSASLGMKGIPAVAEEIAVARDIFLAEYAESPVHFTTVTCARSVDLIRKAKAKGLLITACVAAHHLALEDNAFSGFDTNCKVMPPLRTESDIKALVKGLKDGTIDAVCSDHRPQDEESKKREIDHAEYGITGLQTAYSLVNTFAGDLLSTDDVVASFAIRPRQVLQITVPKISVGETANLTLFQPGKEWIFTSDISSSKSKNSPFFGTKLRGKAFAVFNKGRLHLCR